MSDGFTRRGVLQSLVVSPIVLTLRDEFGVKPAFNPPTEEDAELLRIVLLNASGEEVCEPQFAPNGPGKIIFKQDIRSGDLIHYWAVDLSPGAQSVFGQKYYQQKIGRAHALCDGELSLHFDGNIIECHMS